MTRMLPSEKRRADQEKERRRLAEKAERARQRAIHRTRIRAAKQWRQGQRLERQRVAPEVLVGALEEADRLMEELGFRPAHLL